MEPIFRCPMCKGPIAMWAAHPEFTCHHCHWSLSSNRGVAVARAVAVAAVAELVLFVGLWLLLGGPSAALGVWLTASCVVGYGVGWFALKSFAVLTPLRPPTHSLRKSAAHQPVNP
ncbi:hypothetical protein [Piscinibacter sp.]|uniref:hypothetical protein n=1 Tax=Piscinibacter sp. TaxID=1903157 RepID=UPI002F3EFBD2